MKKLFLALLVAVPGIGLAQQKPNYEINGKLQGIDKISTVYLIYGQGLKRITDSAKVMNNMYTLKGYVQTGQKALLLCFNSKDIKNIPLNGLIQFFISPGKIGITHTGEFNKVTITGAADNDTFNTLMSAANARKNDQAYKQQVLGDFIKRHPDSPVAFAALREMAGPGHQIDGPMLKPYFEILPAAVKESDDGAELGKHINTSVVFSINSAIGSKAADFTLPDTAGHKIKLSDIKGKYILVDFWASWCASCRAENPHLVTAYKQFHSKGFNIISVSVDRKEREKNWHKAIASDHLGSWTHVADLDHPANAAALLYGVETIPQNFLIGPDGKIIARDLNDGDLEKKLAELLSN